MSTTYIETEWYKPVVQNSMQDDPETFRIVAAEIFGETATIEYRKSGSKKAAILTVDGTGAGEVVYCTKCKDWNFFLPGNIADCGYCPSCGHKSK